MPLSEQQVKFLVSQGEGIDLEFKTCTRQLNKDVYETVCAFLNRNGGTLLLGVTDSGQISGIMPDSLEQIRKDFATAVNNPQKLMPPTYLSIETALVEGKPLLVIHVPESSQVHRCNGRIYDRNEDGDFDITNSTAQVAQLYLRKQSSFSENRVYPWIQPGDLRSDLIERCRRHVRINRKNHPWVDMDDTQMLKSAQLLQKDLESQKSGVTLAGVLLFGTDDLILQVCPPHRTDCLLRKVDVERYDDRDLIRTNLLDSYDRILAFIQKHLPDPFYLDGIERRSLRDIIFREVASNLLIHREYSSGVPARLVIERGKVSTWNASRPHGFGLLDPATAVPYPKNPVIGAFFREIDRADELGSGMRNMWHYGKKYGGADPQIVEGDVFRMIISVPEFGQQGAAIPYEDVRLEPGRGQVGTKSGTQSGFSWDPVGTQIPPSPEQRQILHFCLKERSIAELTNITGRTNRTKLRKDLLNPMMEFGWLERTIPDKPTSSKQKYRTTFEGANLCSLFAISSG